MNFPDVIFVEEMVHGGRCDKHLQSRNFMIDNLRLETELVTSESDADKKSTKG